VVQPTILKKPWAKNGMPGYLPHGDHYCRGFLSAGYSGQQYCCCHEQCLGAIPALGTASLLALGVALIIIGGVKRIAHFAQVVVPLWQWVYPYCLCRDGANIEQFPAVVKLIINSAFGLDAGFGAIIGMAVQWGVKRGVYSNEAGQGTAPHAAAAAEVSHPAKQGLVQAFLCLCGYLANLHRHRLYDSDDRPLQCGRPRWSMLYQGLPRL